MSIDTEYQQARTAAVVFDRSDRGKVEVAGPDAARFLHNLSSADVINLSPGAGCEAFFLTQKARVIAHLYVYRPSEALSFWLDLAGGTSAAIVKHLDRYLISEQVELADRSAEFAQVHVAGPGAGDVLGKVVGALPQPMHVLRAAKPVDDCQVRRCDLLGLPGYDVLCPVSAKETLWQALVTGSAVPAGLDAFEALRIEAGTPAFGIDIDESSFAPEVGRNAQAISYTKGCYLGQEPVVMARDRGQVNRTLLRVLLPEGPVPPGSLLYRDGKEVGRVTSSALPPGVTAAVGLAYVRRGNQGPGTALEVETAGQRRRAVIAGASPGTPEH